MIYEQTFAKTKREPGGRSVVHAYERTTRDRTGTWYITACGARATNITGIMPREVTCPRCLVALAKQQAS